MIFKPGDIVKVNKLKAYTPENLLILSTDNNTYKLYPTIDISTYPSCNDFKGKYKNFKNEIFLIVGKKGRPLSFSISEKWDLYDIYYIFYCDQIFECFSHCLERVKNKTKNRYNESS
tara:strand:+ start:997 stop:1347 length:351 start_codon:yes stop_codon:yes gene_type:complete